MGLFDGWPFQSREQQERDRQDFEKRVFPLGVAQRDAALAVLHEGITGKMKDEEKMFAFICAKDACALDGGELEGGLQSAETTLKKQKWISASNRDFILTLMRLDMRASSLEDYPTVEDVRQFLSTSSEGDAG